MTNNDVNPPVSQGKPSDPCLMVIFGATGDLTKRKLLPALYNLAVERLLSQQFAIIGSAVEDLTTEKFRERLSDDMKEFATTKIEADLWEWFLKRIYYVQGDFKAKNAYGKLKELTDQVSREHLTDGNNLYYLATAPAFFSEIVRQLGEAGLAKEESGQWRRVVIEKPFGHDLESAIALNGEGEIGGKQEHGYREEPNVAGTPVLKLLWH